jgi:hypothetical protein
MKGNPRDRLWPNVLAGLAMMMALIQSRSERL